MPVLARDPQIEQAIEAARAQAKRHTLVGPAALASSLTATLAAPDFGDRTILLITATTRDAEDLVAELKAFLPQESVVEFPAWETLPHERLSPTHDTVGRRLHVLRRLAHPEDLPTGASEIQVVVAGIRALLQPIVKGLGDLEVVQARAGTEIDLDHMVDRLASIGYQRTDLVSRRGEFAVRGGIIDVFVPTDDHPVRLEFFGDEVEEVRSFSITDQRSLEVVEQGLWAPPCQELLLTPAVRQRARELAEQYPGLIDVLGPISEGINVEGMESLAPVLCDGMETLLDVLPDETLTLIVEPQRVQRRAEELLATSEEFLAAGWQAASEGAKVPLDVSAASYWSYEDMQDHAIDLGVAWWTFSPFVEGGEDEEQAPEAATIGPVPSLRPDLNAALLLVQRQVREGSKVVIQTAGQGSASRIAEQLADRETPARLVPSLDNEPAANVVTVTTGPLGSGFDAKLVSLLVITESDLLGTTAAARTVAKMPSRRKRAIDPLQLAPGDYIVHEQHGVGQFVELAQRTVGGATREYVVVEYAASKRGQPKDRLFVPTDQLDQISRYVGGEAPSVHRLGGADWTKAKSRARKAVREIAHELVRLYAARQQAPGYAFGPDTPWQAELEDAFPFAETPDQLATIDEVKADMEKSVPMDRIVCGDVGYGKTEIAVRAAFKAVQEGKQVAVLVPTTLLVRQHHQTFSQRFAPFPVRVEALSRFKTAAESKAILEGIHDGSVDVVIATHRLLSPQTRFKDLGLVIVDEEQRFGVEHKEHLKALRTNVDVLTMSATPIPRTLEMSVTGIREMSTITTPPEQRLPVLTYVGPYDDKQITAAIRRELLRDGQVFFLHNRVASIDKAAKRIGELVPEAKIAVAHGQMPEQALEQVIDDFWQRKIDVLVCTTIVESGLDITNANTLIVDRADMFGLSQLHQLRGRVGRGRDRAYAYFLYPAEQTLSETAHERLATIAAHTDLGSGMAVAMKDLEIRGAGNLLGGEQSGHIADVGFDLYVRMVGEALSVVKGEADSEPAEINIELPVDAHIPESYVPEERLRLEAYKRIAAVTNETEIGEVVDELADRYGPIPGPVKTLMDVARLRILARAAGLTEIVIAGSRIRFAPVELPESKTLRLTRLYPGTQIRPATRTALIPRPATAKVGGKPLVNNELLAWTTELVESVLLSPIGKTPT